jgi:hypothetical protein
MEMGQEGPGGRRPVKISYRFFFFPSKKRGVPHISLVFREMWETTAFHVPLSNVEKKFKVRGLPYLAKNERDMGHPTLLGREKEKPVVYLHRE